MAEAFHFNKTNVYSCCLSNELLWRIKSTIFSFRRFLQTIDLFYVNLQRHYCSKLQHILDHNCLICSCRATSGGGH